MKQKQLPRSVKVWLLALGFFAGSLIGECGVLLASILSTFHWIIVAGAFPIGSYLVWFIVSWRYKKTLQAWGLMEESKK